MTMKKTMTEQLYRRRAGEPVQVWRVGDGEPPEWALHCLRTFFDPGDTEGSLAACVEKYRGLLLVENLWPPLPDDWFAREYEPLPAPAPDAREALDEAAINVIREALRFSYWAAGQGIYPMDGEPARDPETFLSEYWNVHEADAEREDIENCVLEKLTCVAATPST